MKKQGARVVPLRTPAGKTAAAARGKAKLKLVGADAGTEPVAARGKGRSRAAPKPPMNQDDLEVALRDAGSYAEWARNAKALDRLGDGERWRKQDASDLYDYRTIQKRLEQLRAALRKGDAQELVFLIEEGVHGNLGGIGKPILYNQARFGTKDLITDYFATFAEALLYVESCPASEVAHSTKMDLFRRASHCYGRSALMFSGGGTLVYFHFGVVSTLLEQNLLPNVMSGSSAGAMTCAVIGTRSASELAQFLTPENLCFGRAWHPNAFERATGLRRMLSVDDWEHSLPKLIPDMTFAEAYEVSGRHISVSVSPVERHHSPRLLNAITSPHVLIRSAVRASCAVPGLFEPVQLMARNAQGKTVPYLGSRWIDGSFAADLPARQLARLYGANHWIVSLINPIMLPVFRDAKLEGTQWLPLQKILKNSTRHYAKQIDRLFGKYLPTSQFGLVNKMLHDVLSQEYAGDINIVPERRLVSPLKLLSPSTREEIIALWNDGRRQTWPRVEMIRNSSLISRTLDAILSRAGQDGHTGY